MSLKFDPFYSISPRIATCLIEIEAIRQLINGLPITPRVLVQLRESARLSSIHYSTKIEGNRLTQEQVEEVIKKSKNFPTRERDEAEVKGYYEALNYIDTVVNQKKAISETTIKTLHGLVMGAGRTKVKPTPYRDGQNVIRSGTTGAIVYLPPEAKDVPLLMKSLVVWINENWNNLPAPLIAAVTHYQLATIHPYYDGNGRTARLLTTLILHLSNYGLKGIYSLDEYYAQDLASYYQELDVGTSHNYYEGRETADITSWILYFCEGMLYAFERVKNQAENAAKRGEHDQSIDMRSLDPIQRKTLKLFKDYEKVTARQLAEVLHLKERSMRSLCHKWVTSGFLVIADPAKKTRKYQLAPQYQELLQ